MGSVIKCPQCGSTLKDDGRFCSYCGTKLPDDVTRIEVKIDTRVEDVAEVKRASYEEQESKIRQKQMKRDMRKGSGLWIVVGLLIYIAILLANHKMILGSVVSGLFAVLILMMSFFGKRS